MKNQYTVKRSKATKVTVTITQQQLWTNAVECIGDMTYNDLEFDGVSLFKEIKDVLCVEIPDQHHVRQLFRAGHTPFIVGEAMDEIDNYERGVYTEIEVVWGNGTVVTVPHEDINF